jgi:hypothetical protein
MGKRRDLIEKKGELWIWVEKCHKQSLTHERFIPEAIAFLEHRTRH